MTLTVENRLKQLRDGSGMTQQDLANRAGLAVAVIQKIEGGVYVSPSLKTLLRLSCALAVPSVSIFPVLGQVISETKRKQIFRVE